MPVRLNGSTSGYVELAAPAVAGTTTLELPTDSIKPGLVLVAAESFSAVSSVSVNNCFTATYDNYRIEYTFTNSSLQDVNFRVRASGTDLTTSTYKAGTLINSYTNSVAAVGSSSQSSLFCGKADSSVPALMHADVLAPFLARNTAFSAAGIATFALWTNGMVDNTTSYDGFTMFPASGTLTGTIRVYGYRNSL